MKEEGLRFVEAFEVEPHTIRGVKYGTHVVIMEFPHTPWYKRILLHLEMWWKR